MIISAIAAMGQNRVIGAGNKMMWRLPHEWDYFKQTTLGHCIVTGRKNFEAQGRALPDRTNIVVTRSKDYQAKDAIVVHSLEEAIEFAKTKNEQELFICGGGQIYEQAMPLCERLYLTYVDFSEDGEVYFPEFKEENYSKELVKEMGVQDDNKLAWKAYLYQRK